MTPQSHFLGLCPEKNMIRRDTRTPVFIAALFKIVRAWKHLNVNRGIDKEEGVHIYNGILLIHNKEWNDAICSNLSDLGASLVAQLVKNPPAMWGTWVQSLGWEDPLEKGKATHPLQYSGLENSMDCIVHEVTKSWTRPSNFHKWS